jgi:hypothetical protein
VRKFCKGKVFSTTRLRSQEHVWAAEVRAMLRDLYAAAPRPSAAPVRLIDHLYQLTMNHYYSFAF